MSKCLDIAAIIIGWLGAALMFFASDVLVGGAPRWTSEQRALELDRSAQRRRLCQRIGFVLITLSLLLQSIAKLG